jgi:hypothetical protein
MKYTTPGLVMSYLPNEIRNNTAKEDLVTYIIRGYQSLEIYQDNNYKNILIQLENNHNAIIPKDVQHVHRVQLLDIKEGCDTCTSLIPIYPTNITSTYCKDINVCSNNCDLNYSITGEQIKLPVLNSSYLITTTSLYSNELQILDDPTIIEFLKYYAMHEVVLNRSLTNDVSINLLDRISQQMNFLYTKARGMSILKSITKRSQQLERTNYGIDEFNNRHSSTTSTRW